jgi:hypothetical protein
MINNRFSYTTALFSIILMLNTAGLYYSYAQDADSLIQYVYDDGVPEGGYFWNNTGSASAVRITPVQGRFLLVGMSIYFTGISSGDAVYKPIVLNSEGGVPDSGLIDADFKTAAVLPGWDSTDLTPYNIFVDGEFFVGLEYDGINNPMYGYDRTDNGRSWDYNGTEWVPFNETYFIRATVQTLVTSIEIDSRVPDNFEVHPNYPNPFNSSTVISYSLPVSMDVSLIMYNVSGEAVAELVNSYQSAGSYKVTWNGKDNSGREAGSGIYFCRIRAGNNLFTHKMLLLK